MIEVGERWGGTGRGETGECTLRGDFDTGGWVLRWRVECTLKPFLGWVIFGEVRIRELRVC